MGSYRIPDLYEINLITLTKVLHALEDLTKIEGLFSCEIRVKVDDVDSWAVIGWGEAGEPCILRFEDEFEPVLKPPTMTIGGGGISHFTSNNNQTRPLKE